MKIETRVGRVHMTGHTGKNEEQWHGVGVSDGVAVGRVLRLHNGAPSVYRTSVAESEIEAEIARMNQALAAAHNRLAEIKERAEHELGVEHGYIFDAHLAILEDAKLRDEIVSCIRREQVNAEWAVKVVTDNLLRAYAKIKDEYLRERGSDIEDVTRRILKLLNGVPHVKGEMTHDAIIVAEELLPSTLAELDLTSVRAVVSDVGGWTSHAAIIARGLGIPAVVGVRDLHRIVRTGDHILVDATHGMITLHPTQTRLFEFGNAISPVADRRRETAVVAKKSVARQPLYTLDGERIYLRANIEFPAEYAGVDAVGAHGIGLYRSEFLGSFHNRMPTEDEQFATYMEVACVAGDDVATIRLFDFGGDKFALEGLEPERNPALGLRAIRLGLRHKTVLRTQARALLKVAHHRPNLGVVLPMISDVADVRRAREVIEECRRELQSQDVPIGELRLGAMIEVPSAVMTVERIAKEVDFLNLGTNDLVQYLLAVDRGNDAVAGWFRSLHPAVLSSIRRTLDAARAESIPTIICGEMAAAPAYAFVLIGLGARDLSMSAASIPRVRQMVEGITTAHARRIADECLECSIAEETEEIVRQRLGAELSHLFTPEMLPAKT